MYQASKTINSLSEPRSAPGESVAATMSSREIAELVGSRHADVMRTIDRLIEKNVVLGCTPSAYTHEQNGQPYAQYLVSKRDSFVVVAQLCPEFTAALVDRWQELEAQAKQPRELSRMDLIQMALASEQETLRVTAERDLAIATKALIGSKREATAMATASAAKRQVKQLEAELGRNEHHATVIAVERATGTKLAKNAYVALRRWCKANDKAATEVTDPRYGSVKAWPAGAWLAAFGVDLAALFGGVAQ